jgi:phosphonopyruvate decarboxylase
LEDVSNQDDLDRLFVTAKSHLDNRKSYGIVIDKGCVEKVPYVGIDDVKERKSGKFENLCTDHVSDLPSRYEVLEYVAELSGTSRPIIATTGKTGRELFTIRDSANHFYMVGSMGYACSIGLGVAMNTNKQTIVIDGDGALLMNMGALATIGHFAPKNFVHIVIDNGLYESTGGQPTTSENVDFAAVAHHCGYHYAVNVDDLSSFNEVMKRMINSATAMVGPSLICIKASTNKIDDLARPDIHPRDVAARFREFLKGE